MWDCCCLVTSVVSDSVRPHRRQPTRLRHPRDSPGKNTGVGCHCLLQCMQVKSESEVAQSCPTLHDPMDCQILQARVLEWVPGILQARVLEWVAIAFFDMGLRCKLLYIRQMRNSSILYSQYPVINHNGKEYKNMLPFCAVEISTTL